MLSLLQHAKSRNITPTPPRWEAAFGREALLEVDLGSGRGDYALERAARFPELNMVALEVRKKWVALLRQRSKNLGLPNLRTIRCDLTQDLPMLFAPSSVNAFTLHHPDPWWKKRHRKRRVVSPEFVALIYRLLKPQGWFFAQTDVEDLADEILEAFSKNQQFEPRDGDHWKRVVMGEVRSHREKRCMKLGLPIRRLVFCKRPIGSSS